MLSALLNGLQPVQPFLAGGLGGCISMTVILPVDNIKVRLQLLSVADGAAPRQGPIQLARSVIAKEGALALYSGLTAAWARMMVYGSARIGIFRVASNAAKERNGGAPLPLSTKMALGMLSGGVASFVGNPADLALVRMQSDALSPVDKRRNYRGIVDAITRIVREEGVARLWRGSIPTVIRAIALNSAMLATSDQAKEFLAPHFGGMTSWTTMFLSSTLAGVNAAIASLPFDMLKTRLQQMKPLADGTMPYKGVVDCATQIVKKEGVLALYTGLPTYMVRIAPYAFITLVATDLINGVLDNARARANATTQLA